MCHSCWKKKRHPNSYYIRAEPMLAPGQWETSLQSNAVSHWLGANLKSALYIVLNHCGAETGIIRTNLQGPYSLSGKASYHVIPRQVVRYRLRSVIRSEIWQVYRQQCCWCTGENSERCTHGSNQSHRRDFTRFLVRRLSAYWMESLIRLFCAPACLILNWSSDPSHY